VVFRLNHNQCWCYCYICVCILNSVPLLWLLTSHNNVHNHKSCQAGLSSLCVCDASFWTSKIKHVNITSTWVVWQNCHQMVSISRLSVLSNRLKHLRQSRRANPYMQKPLILVLILRWPQRGLTLIGIQLLRLRMQGQLMRQMCLQLWWVSVLFLATLCRLAIWLSVCVSWYSGMVINTWRLI